MELVAAMDSGKSFHGELDGEDRNLRDLLTSFLLKPASIVRVTEKMMTLVSNRVSHENWMTVYNGFMIDDPS
ncbi:unnamed protein product [Brassica oleracea var. botrytis]|uniref:(rape) hypothetical protein n=1 Tax=Brassica napus TaxID=3708 RepID=A0A816IFF2_BRANA|nr:unnamed protein product [Brassica napus]